MYWKSKLPAVSNNMLISSKDQSLLSDSSPVEAELLTTAGGGSSVGFFFMLATSSSANLGRARAILTRAALKICSAGGMHAAKFVFSVSRVMKNMKPLALIWSSAKLALPAGMPVCLLRSASTLFRNELISGKRTP